MASAKVKPNDKKFSMMKNADVLNMAQEKSKRGQKARKEAAKRGINVFEKIAESA